MDGLQYAKAWGNLMPAATLTLQRLHDLVAQRIPAGLTLSQPLADDQGDEYRLSMDIRHSTGTFVLAVDYVLLDGDSEGEGGLAGVVRIQGYGGLVLGGDYPFNCTEEAYTSDFADLKRRIECVSIDELAQVVMTGLHSAELKSSLADLGVSY